jgi:hypothetical protein
MSGNHRAEQETSKARVAVAGALTAGALLLAPVGVALATPAIAHAAGPTGGGSGNPGGPGGGGSGGGVGPGNPAPPGGGSGGSGGPGGPGGGGGRPTTPCVHKNIIRLLGLKIEIKHVQGQPPKINVVVFPGLHRVDH